MTIIIYFQEWLYIKLNSWKNNSKASLLGDTKVNGVSSSPVGAKIKHHGSLDALLAELTHTAGVFEEISDNCLLLLHLEVII